MSVAGHRDGFHIGQALDTYVPHPAHKEPLPGDKLSPASYAASLLYLSEILDLPDGHPRGRELARRNMVRLVMDNMTVTNRYHPKLPLIVRHDIRALQTGDTTTEDYWGSEAPVRSQPGRLAFEDNSNWRENFEWEDENLRTQLHPGSTFPEDEN